MTEISDKTAGLKDKVFKSDIFSKRIFAGERHLTTDSKESSVDNL